MSDTDQKPKTATVIRLRPDLIAEIGRKAGVVVVTKETTPLQAGYQLGIQKVLELLRQEYQIGE